MSERLRMEQTGRARISDKEDLILAETKRVYVIAVAVSILCAVVIGGLTLEGNKAANGIVFGMWYVAAGLEAITQCSTGTPAAKICRDMLAGIAIGLACPGMLMLTMMLFMGV